MKRLLSLLLVFTLLLCSVAATPLNATNNQQTSTNIHELMLMTNGVDTSNLTYKVLNSCYGNSFTLIETGAKGFYIYDAVSERYLEASEDSPSPYLNYTDNLYYFGPMSYYVKNGDSYIHTLFHETYSSSAIDYEENCFSEALSNVRSIVEEQVFSLRTNTYIPNQDHIRYATYPANSSGTCGYVAACLVLYYWHKCAGGIIPNTYLDVNGKLKTTGYTLQDKLLSYGYSSSTWALTIRDVLIDYCSDFNISASSSWHVGQIGITSSINNGRPAILFGMLPTNPSTSNIPRGSVSHAVTVYGLSGSSYICHYGWSGYSHVYLDSGLAGSNTTFQLT